MSAVLDVVLRSVWVEGVGTRYDVLLDGEVIVHHSRDPEYEAARVLHARGFSGRFRTIDFKTGTPRMTFDLEKAAKLRTVERDRGGLTVEPHLQMSERDRTRLRAPSLDQGRAIPSWRAQESGQPIEYAGGETWEAPALSPPEDEAWPLAEDA